MTDSLFDDQKPGHQKALRKLENDQIAWLGSGRPDGQPHTVPVWFLWRDGQVVIFSEERAQKIRNLRNDNKVVVSLESGGTGSDVVILEGTAEIAGENTAAWLGRVGDAYQTKYAEGLKGLGQSMDEMSSQFNQVIVVTPAKLMAW